MRRSAIDHMPTRTRTSITVSALRIGALTRRGARRQAIAAETMRSAHSAL
ncbi:MAG: hypothetical protein ACR2GC_09225 [Methyloceanibacter sp.]